jgi:hypothetical protein
MVKSKIEIAVFVKVNTWIKPLPLMVRLAAPGPLMVRFATAELKVVVKVMVAG